MMKTRSPLFYLMLWSLFLLAVSATFRCSKPNTEILPNIPEVVVMEPAEEPIPEVSKAPQHQTFSFQIFFDLDHYDINYKYFDILTAIDKTCGKGEWLIRLDGYACEIGTNAYNLALSDKRARSIQQHLYQYMVNAKIEVTAWGEERPSGLGHEYDRRVDIVLEQVK